MLKIFHSLKRLLSRESPLPIIVIGTHFECFQLCEQLNASKRYVVNFVIDEEPWQHKTFFAGAQCRYPSELVALAKNYSIGAVVYFSGRNIEWLTEEHQRELSALDCKLIALENGFVLDDSENLIES